MRHDRQPQPVRGFQRNVQRPEAEGAGFRRAEAHLDADNYIPILVRDLEGCLGAQQPEIIDLADHHVDAVAEYAPAGRY